MSSFKKSLLTGLMLLGAAALISAPATAASNRGKDGATQRSKPAQTTPSTRKTQRVRVTVEPNTSRKTAAVVVRRTKVVAVAAPPRLSFGQAFGLHDTVDKLELKSSVALVMDQETQEVLFSKNSQAVLPIASITKLMTAMVVTDANLPLDEMLTITDDDIDTEKGSRSRLKIGTQLSRGDMLHLALMSSENRAAHALGRHYPGGLSAFVAAMNHKAQALGLHDTRYVEPTGLSSRNQSSARDLAALVGAAHQVQIIRELSTSPEYMVEIDHQVQHFKNTNGLVNSPAWEIGLQKTGYISEAGRCLVMQAKLAGRKLIMVFLDSAGRYSRIGDAERIRKWIEGSSEAQAAVPALVAPTAALH